MGKQLLTQLFLRKVRHSQIDAHCRPMLGSSANFTRLIESVSHQNEQRQMGIR